MRACHTSRGGALARTASGFDALLTDGTRLKSRRLFVATGLVDELPDIPGVRARFGREVLHCPYCHGFEVRQQGRRPRLLAELLPPGHDAAPVLSAPGRTTGLCREGGNTDPVTDAEAEVARVAVALTAPADEECLYCYLRRMLHEFGCANDHRFTKRWAHGRKVRGRPVLRWAQDTGACCCDCEVILNSFGRPSTRRRGLLCEPALAELAAADQIDAGLPATVAGEPIDLLVWALEDVRMVRQPAEMASIATDFPGVAGAALYRALLRVEAEHLLAEADRLGPVLTGVLTSGDHRRDALIDLLGRIRAAPGGRALRFGSG